jgi:uncharacterized SAM-binding protein YcdF (DUF218 family)
LISLYYLFIFSMFLYLSKLLPLFIYPLGLACVLLTGSLLLLWKRPRIAAVCMVLALTVLLVGGNGWVATQVVKSLEWQNLPTGLPRAEAIVVLGGATRPQVSPRPWIDLQEESDRILHGAQLYRQGKAPLVILSGGRIDWQESPDRIAGSEAADMAALMQTMGVPGAAILQDSTSLNTRENAVNVKKIMDERGIHQILLVTSAMHMPRSLRIFQKLGINPIPAPTDFLVSADEAKSEQSIASALLDSIPDAENLRRLTRALKEYVGLLIYSLRGWI